MVHRPRDKNVTGVLFFLVGTGYRITHGQHTGKRRS